MIPARCDLSQKHGSHVEADLQASSREFCHSQNRVETRVRFHCINNGGIGETYTEFCRNTTTVCLHVSVLHPEFCT